MEEKKNLFERKGQKIETERKPSSEFHFGVMGKGVGFRVEPDKPLIPDCEHRSEPDKESD